MEFSKQISYIKYISEKIFSVLEKINHLKTFRKHPIDTECTQANGLLPICLYLPGGTSLQQVYQEET